MTNKKETIFLLAILVIAAILRFYNLMHDSPYFFNPDERNMANAISQFRLPAILTEIPKCILSEFNSLSPKPYPLNPNCNLNPHFFAYGQFPLYLAFSSDQITSSIINNVIPGLTRDPSGFRLPASKYGVNSGRNDKGTFHNEILTTSFPSSIFWLRFWSSLSSTLTVLFVYLITKELFKRVNSQLPTTNYYLPTIAAILAAFTPGLIQSAHFGTTESLLTFLFMVSVYLSLRYLPAQAGLGNLSNPKFVLLTSLTIGIATGSKLTGIFFLFPPFISMMIRTVELINKRRKKNLATGLLGYWVIGLLVFIGSILFFALTSPYNLVAPAEFKSAVFGYESDVAMGKYEAFYTRQFVNTTPVLFQIEKVFPYALGWPVFILGTLGFLLVTTNLIVNVILLISAKIQNSKFLPRRQAGKIQNYKSKVKNNPLLNFNLYFFLLTFTFLLYLVPNAFLFAKWTRFMTPIFPFFSIFAAYLFFSFRRSHPARRGATSLGYLFYILVITSILPGLAFMSIYTHEDSRVTASKWIYKNIPNNSYILSETANVVDIPLSIPNYTLDPRPYTLNVISFDFYHMDENSMIFNDLFSHLSKADYIFIPSRRIFANYPKLPNKYPLTTKYYQLLFSGALGFEKVSEISSFPILPILNYQLPDENAEETFTVFDHPVVRIYKKTHPFTIDEYRLLFNKSI